MLRSWNAAGAAACEGEVTYTRLDGSKVTVPFANVFVLKGGGGERRAGRFSTAWTLKLAAWTASRLALTERLVDLTAKFAAHFAART